MSGRMTLATSATPRKRYLRSKPSMRLRLSWSVFQASATYQGQNGWTVKPTDGTRPAFYYDKFSTSTDTGPAMPIVTIAVPGSFKYTFESMRSLRQELKLCRGAHFVRVHWNPARTSNTQIQDWDEFRRRSPSIRLFDPNKEEQGIKKDRTPRLFFLTRRV